MEPPQTFLFSANWSIQYGNSLLNAIPDVSNLQREQFGRFATEPLLLMPCLSSRLNIPCHGDGILLPSHERRDTIMRKRLRLTHSPYAILQILSLTLFEKPPLLQVFAEHPPLPEPSDMQNQQYLPGFLTGQ
jgi:hypothetical protein